MEAAKLANVDDDDLVDVCMTGGPPWGFNISGGSEFGTPLIVKKVTKDGIAQKVGGLQEGDTLVYINNMKCTSRSKAIEVVRTGNNELKIKLRRSESGEPEVDGFVTRPGPKRSRSYYDSVVENMLENMNNDISSTQYSSRRSKIQKEKELELTSKVNVVIEAGHRDMVTKNMSNHSKDEQKENLMPSDEYMGMRRTSSGNIQKVTIKSVNVTAMVPKAKEVIADQMKAMLGVTDARNVASKSGLSHMVSSVANSQAKLKSEKVEISMQSRSVDEGDPTVHHYSGNVSGLRKNNNTPPVANRSLKPEPSNQESGIETPALSVSKTRAMFEEISKSQENLAASSVRSRSTDSLLKTDEREMPPIWIHQPGKQPAVSQNTNLLLAKKEQGLFHHSHTKSLPLEADDNSRRVMRRPGSAPHRRSDRHAKAKSAHFPSEKELFQSQNLPLGYADIPSAASLIHGRKSIANCSPGIASYQYKKESSFRHSSEDLRRSDSVDLGARKSATLPAHQMREAAKKFHQDLMRKDPKFRYSLSTGECANRTGHLGSFTGGSSGSSVGSSQDMLHAIDLSRRASGPTFFTRASSTSSLLDSPPAHQESPYLIESEDNSILSRLLREQRQNSGGSLVRIEEEARSPRGKNFKNRDGTLSSNIGEPECVDTSTRTISIQTDFVYQDSSKNAEQKQSGGSSEDASQSPVTKSVASFSAAETDKEAVVRSSDQASSAGCSSPEVINTCDPSHKQEASTDSTHELQAINEHKYINKADSFDNFTLSDIDALPPPPDELLIGSPPEKEKPQRVINRKKRDQHSALNWSRNSSCVSTDSAISTATADSGIGALTFSTSDSPRTSPTRDSAELDDYDKEQNVDEGFKSSREALDDEEYDQSTTRTSSDELEAGVDQHKMYTSLDADHGLASPARLDTPDSSCSGSRPGSMILVSPKIEELDQEKTLLFKSMRKNIEELKNQEKEIGEEIKLNEDLGKKVQSMVERKATQTEFSKYELFIGELNKIVALLLSLTQRLHRYEQMLQDLDISEEEDKQKRDSLVSKIEKLKSQLEDACYLREVNDKRGENVANFLDKYFNEEEFQDFLYYVDMKSQLALMQSEIKEKVKLGEERYQALASTGNGWGSSTDKL